MKRLLLSLFSIAFFSSPMTHIIGCSTGKSNSDIDGSVQFDEKSYNVLAGRTVSVFITNYDELSQKGFVENISIRSSNDSIASYTPTNEGSKSSILIQGISQGSANIVVSYTNAQNKVVFGSFVVRVQDFSDINVAWRGINQSSPISLYTSAYYISFGSIAEWKTLEDDDLVYDYQNGFSATLVDKSISTGLKLTDFLEPNGIVDSSGQICFKLKSNPNITDEDKSWTQSNLSDLTVTLVNKSLNINISNTGFYVSPYTATTNITTNTLDNINFNDLDNSQSTNPKVNNNNDGSYTLVYSLKSVGTIDDSYIDSSIFEFSTDKITLVKKQITKNNEYSITIKPNTDKPFNSLSMTVDLLFTETNSADGTLPNRFAGSFTQNFTDYIKSIDDIDGSKVKETKLDDSNTEAKLFLSTDEYTPIDYTTTLNDTYSSIISSGYSLNDTLVVNTDNSIIEMTNPDPKNLTQSISQTDIDKAKVDSQTFKSKLAFSINEITIENNSLTLSASGVNQTSDIASMSILAVFKDSANNIIVASLSLRFDSIDESVEFGYSTCLDTSSLGSDSIINDDSIDSSVSLDVHNGLSISKGLEVSSEDKEIKLSLKNLTNSKIDYSKWKVSSSNSDVISIKDNSIDSDGNVTLVLVGKGDSDVKESSSIISFTSSNDDKQVITQKLYTSAFAGKQEHKKDLSSLTNNKKANITISKNLTQSSLYNSQISAEYGTIEFEDGYKYDLYNPLLSLSNEKTNSVKIDSVIFDGDVEFSSSSVLQCGDKSGFDGNIIFNKSVTFHANSSGLEQTDWGCGIISSNRSDAQGYFSRIIFNDSVSIDTANESSNVDTSRFAVGLISSGTMSSYGSIFVNKNISIDSSDWINGSVATGVIVSNTSTNNIHEQEGTTNLDIKGNVTINGSSSLTKAFIDDYAGYMKFSSDSSFSIEGTLTIGTVDSTITANQSFGYGNAIYSRISYFDKYFTLAQGVNININEYKDLSGANVAAQIKSKISSNVGSIAVASKTIKIDSDLEKDYDDSKVWTILLD